MTTPFDNMSPEKAQFIKQIVSDAAGKNHQLSKMLAKQSKKTPPPQSNT